MRNEKKGERPKKGKLLLYREKRGKGITSREQRETPMHTHYIKMAVRKGKPLKIAQEASREIKY